MLRLIFLLLFACIFVTVLSLNQAGPKYPPTLGEIWPKPQFQVKKHEYFIFSGDSFSFSVSMNNCKILDKSLKRALKSIKKLKEIAHRNSIGEHHKTHGHRSKHFLGKVDELTVELKNPCEKIPHLHMDERYELSISSNSILKSASIWGILRGLESFTHLFYIVDAEVRINMTNVTDYPQYKHRGLLLDTGRHYLSVQNILTTLDAMAMNKMNVFHWHIVDDQSFPYVSERFPKLSEKGAFHHTLVYHKQDIQKIFEFARMRGIRVIPEFDVPGHTRSWGNAYPEILTECTTDDGKRQLGPMNPVENATYQLLKHLYHELETVFPDKYFHIGGDEIDYSCWESNPAIIKYMQEHNIKDIPQLMSLFLKRVTNLLPTRTIPIVWQEVFDKNVTLPQDALIHVWKSDSIKEMVHILKSGHKLLFSSSWYLDILTDNVAQFYDAEPRDMVSGHVNASVAKNIVGGEACMWGEMVDDTNVISRVWGRASAVAEVLWSNTRPSEPDGDMLKAVVKPVVSELYNRLEEHVCRMRRFGVNAQPSAGPGFCVV